MIWGKRQQFIFWIVAYTPLFLIMIYRFIDSNNYFKQYKLIIWVAGVVNKTIFDIVIVFIIIFCAWGCYKITVNFYLGTLKTQLENGTNGTRASVRKYNKLTANEYSFFLLTLIVPLASIDHSSVVNFLITYIVILLAITIHVKTDYLVTCPIFFVTGYQIFRATISYGTREEEQKNESLKKDVIILTKMKYLDLNYKFRVIELVTGIYYLTQEIDEQSTD